MGDYIRAGIGETNGRGWRLFLATDERLEWSGHVTRQDRLSNLNKLTIFQGTLEGWRRRGWHRKCWTDNIKKWTSVHARSAHDDLQRKRLEDLNWIIPHNTPPHPPEKQLVWGPTSSDHFTNELPLSL